MKIKNYLSSLLLLASGSFAANAQFLTSSPSPIIDGTESVTITYHPKWDTGSADTTRNRLKYVNDIYIYTGYNSNVADWLHTNSTGWGGADAYYKMTKVDSNDYTYTFPNLRSYYGLVYSGSADTLIDSINLIFTSAHGDTQTDNRYIPVFEPTATGSVITYTPDPVYSNTSSIEVHFHPYFDTTNGGTGNTSLPFENYMDSMFVYTWVPVTVPANPALNHEAVSWGAVETTPSQYVTKIDSNDFKWTVTDPTVYYHLGADTTMDTIGVIFRSGSGSPQTENFYIPVTQIPTGVVTISGLNSFGLQVMPNPATSEITAVISNEKNASSTLRVMNVMGQIVMTKNIDAQNNRVKISLNDLSAGTYYVELSSGNKRAIQKVVKE